LLTLLKETGAAEPGGSKFEAARGFAATRPAQYVNAALAKAMQKRCKGEQKRRISRRAAVAGRRPAGASDKNA
jgi:hypothetical protein